MPSGKTHFALLEIGRGSWERGASPTNLACGVREWNIQTQISVGFLTLIPFLTPSDILSLSVLLQSGSLTHQPPPCFPSSHFLSLSCISFNFSWTRWLSAPEHFCFPPIDQLMWWCNCAFAQLLMSYMKANIILLNVKIAPPSSIRQHGALIF